MGSIDLQLHILPQQEADCNPVGKERNEPNKEPTLLMPEKGRSYYDKYRSN